MIFQLKIHSKKMNLKMDSSDYYFDSLQTLFAWVKSRIDLPEQNIIDMAYFFKNGDIYIIESGDTTIYYELLEIQPYTMGDI